MNMKRFLTILSLCISLMPFIGVGAQQTISLAGTWDFAIEQGAEANSSLFTLR